MELVRWLLVGEFSLGGWLVSSHLLLNICKS